MKTVTATNTSLTAGPGYGVVFLQDLVADADLGFSGNGEAAAAVCALVPQSGVMAVVFDSD
ncbi:MAG: hypothetical protein OEU32_17430 [Acidimicrobiia bacterium]|nr:hypothetical protein [Acidimicrobiia bacterium]